VVASTHGPLGFTYIISKGKRAHGVVGLPRSLSIVELILLRLATVVRPEVERGPFWGSVVYKIGDLR
jgi:hypothetical protein